MTALVRAVGAISVNLHPLRDEPAANEIPIPGGQELGTTVTALTLTLWEIRSIVLS